jgi:hypothetical protein
MAIIDETMGFLSDEYAVKGVMKGAAASLADKIAALNHLRPWPM